MSDRWYCGTRFYKAEQAVVQVPDVMRHPIRKRPTIPDEIHRQAMKEYNRQGHNQTHERIQERGGLCAYEVIMLLADALNRARALKGQR